MLILSRVEIILIQHVEIYLHYCSFKLLIWNLQLSDHNFTPAIPAGKKVTSGVIKAAHSEKIKCPYESTSWRQEICWMLTAGLQIRPDGIKTGCQF